MGTEGTTTEPTPIMSKGAAVSLSIGQEGRLVLRHEDAQQVGLTIVPGEPVDAETYALMREYVSHLLDLLVPIRPRAERTTKQAAPTGKAKPTGKRASKGTRKRRAA